MGGFISLIENLAPGLYVIGGLMLLWNIRALFVSRGELRFAQYGLEKELAQRRGGRAVTLVFVMAELLIAVWAISTLAAPTWSDGLPDTPEINVARDFFTATPAGGGELAIDANARPTDGPGILATAPPPSTPVGTIQPSDPRRGCDPETAWIQIPANGQLIFEETSIIGTANVENFSKYRFEIRNVENASNFSLFPAADYTEPVVNNVLGNILPVLFNGEYRFRLTVFDTNNAVAGQCEITIFITEPPLTATPLGAGAPQ